MAIAAVAPTKFGDPARQLAERILSLFSPAFPGKELDVELFSTSRISNARVGFIKAWNADGEFACIARVRSPEWPVEFELGLTPHANADAFLRDAWRIALRAGWRVSSEHGIPVVGYSDDRSMSPYA